ncbi:MAG: hypothetical protein LQ352_001777 [Teloschistes flavicans]|nr:MAG: hypothetical protein LQ352_001777 [Teloschistes flavicans]
MGDLDYQVSDHSLEELSDGSIEESSPSTHAWPTISDVHRVLRPLQDEADRVGKQVEQFAETLDRLSSGKQTKPQHDCVHALDLVDAYRNIAKHTVAQLREIHSPEKERKLSRKLKSRTQGSSATPEHMRSPHRDSVGSSTADDLDRWEQEEQTWHLLELMLQVEYPSFESTPKAAASKKRSQRPGKEGEIHQFSSERSIWSRFLASDDQAWERHIVVEWLKASAGDSGQDIEKAFQDMEATANRGSGLWAHSWLHTKEAIKGQKRLRSWPQALAPDAPGIDDSLRKSNGTCSLITQLDPDAVTRQDRALETPDANFERATWLTCWEMLRRGKDWESTREWCQDRVEYWRAISIRGEPRHPIAHDKKISPPIISGPEWLSRALWRKSCAFAARAGVMDKYEAGVYGLLSGHLPSVLKVCTSWNDYIFAHYNSYLLRSFDQYVSVHLPNRSPRGLQDGAGAFAFNMTGGHRAQSGNQLIEKMSHLKSLAKEAKDPFKLLQGSLIGKSFQKFVRSHGLELAYLQERTRTTTKQPREQETTCVDYETALIKPDDYQIIRVIAHMLLIYQELGVSLQGSGQDYGSETFIDTYVDFLSRAGKQQLLPIYASRLSPQRAVSCLGRQLPLILDHGERQTMMRLMKQYEIDVPGVLNHQLQTIISERKTDEFSNEHGPGFPNLSILDKPSEKRQREMRIIRDGFMGKVITDDQHDLINGFQWYLLLDGYWEQTLATGALLYKYFLRLSASRGLAAAQSLSKRVKFSMLSWEKTKTILGHEVDLSNVYRYDEDGMPGYHSASSSRGQDYSLKGYMPSIQRQPEKEMYLLRRSQTFLGLEQLLDVLTALERWQAEMKRKPRDFELSRTLGKKWRDVLKETCISLEMKLKPLLHGWLQDPQDDIEALQLEQIRNACLPEVILAYITVLNYSAHYISREYLLKALDVGAAIATKDSDLARCFVATHRMPELMDLLAIISTNMLVAEEFGRGNKRVSAKMALWSGKDSSSTAT